MIVSVPGSRPDHTANAPQHKLVAMHNNAPEPAHQAIVYLADGMKLFSKILPVLNHSGLCMGQDFPDLPPE
jgi:hypothetical protein